MTGPLDERVRDRIVAETRGNPLALLELPRGLTHRAARRRLRRCRHAPLSGRIEASFRRRFEPLPAATRRLLLIAAAAEPVGDAALLWRAAARLGIGAEAAAPAEAAGLFRLGATVRFRHPLVRSAVYRGAPPDERRAVHAALAEATDPEAGPRPPRVASRAGRRRARTRTSPRSSSARPAARRRAAGWPRRPRSSSARWR